MRRERSGTPDEQRLVQCPVCHGRGDACERCSGLGQVDPDEEASEDLPAQVAKCVGEFVDAWSLIQQYKVAGWLLLTGRRRSRLSESFLEALKVFGAELNRLEHEEDVEEARRSQERSQRR